MSEKEIDHDYTKEIICPYCGYEHGDSWEKSNDVFDGDLPDMECDDCNKTFSVYRNGEITYSTSPRTNER